MAVFSKYAAVLEADGTSMSVRSAKQPVLIVDDDPLVLASFGRITRDLPVRLRFEMQDADLYSLRFR